MITMKNILLKFKALLLTFAVLFTVGCDGDESTPSDIFVSNGSSQTERAEFPVEVCGVTLEKAVERSVSLSPAATEIICELGFRNTLVGIGSYCDYPVDLAVKRVGSTENPDLEAIIALEPDAVFTLSPLSERETYLLGQSGIAVLTAKMPSHLSEYQDLYSDIASAFYGKTLLDDGVTKRSDKIGTDAAEALESAAAALTLGSFVYITGKQTIAGNGTFESAVLGLAGDNVCTRTGYITLDDYYEELRTLEPLYMIADRSLTEDDLRKSATFTKLLNNGTKLLFVNSQYFERPTARTAEIFDQLTIDN